MRNKRRGLTGDTGEQLAGKVLDLRTWKGYKSVALEEIKDALAQQIRDDTDVIAKIKGVSEMYAFVSIGLVVE